MAMKLNNLENLHFNMNKQGLIKTKFEFRFRGLVFSVIYIAESFPHTLLIGCIAHNLFLVLDVSEEYEIATYLGNNYKPLIEALDLNYDPDNPFRPSEFFTAFISAIPLNTTAGSTPTVTDIARISRDAEESNKIHFCGWLPHDGVNSRPRPPNLDKTRKLCGEEAYRVCLNHHISSRWSDIESNSVPYHAPSI